MDDVRGRLAGNNSPPLFAYEGVWATGTSQQRLYMIWTSTASSVSRSQHELMRRTVFGAYLGQLMERVVLPSGAILHMWRASPQFQQLNSLYTATVATTPLELYTRPDGEYWVRPSNELEAQRAAQDAQQRYLAVEVLGEEAVATHGYLQQLQRHQPQATKYYVYDTDVGGLLPTAALRAAVRPLPAFPVDDEMLVALVSTRPSMRRHELLHACTRAIERAAPRTDPSVALYDMCELVHSCGCADHRAYGYEYDFHGRADENGVLHVVITNRACFWDKDDGGPMLQPVERGDACPLNEWQSSDEDEEDSEDEDGGSDD